MTTTANLKVIKGFPYQIRVRAPGKWDSLTEQIFSEEGEEVSITTETYDGLKMNYIESYQSADKVDFSNTVLPWKYEYSTYLSTDRYCLMPVGQDYENVGGVQWVPSNFNNVGSVSIDENKVASGFTSSKYLKLQSVFNPSSNPWEMVFKVKTGSDVTSTHCINGSGVLSGADFQGVCVITLGGNFVYYLSSTGSSWDIVSEAHGSTSIQTNTWYYVKLEFTGSAYVLSLSTDGQTWTTDSTTTSSASVYVSSQPMVIGGSFYSSTNISPWNGEIDLSESYIKINGSDWWVPEFTKSSSGTTETLPGCTYNYTDDGSATTLNCFTINGDEGIVLTPDSEYGVTTTVNNVFTGSIYVLGWQIIVTDSWEQGEPRIYEWDKTYETIGNPTDVNGTISDFSATDYVQTYDVFNPANHQWEIEGNISGWTTGTEQIVAESEGFKLGINASGHPFATFIGQNGIITTITGNDVLGNGEVLVASYVKYDWEEDFAYRLSYSVNGTMTDGGRYASEELINAGKVKFGVNIDKSTTSYTDVFSGAITLYDSSVMYIMDTEYSTVWEWDGSYDVIGNVDISYPEELGGEIPVASDFSSGNYIQTNEVFNPSDNLFTIMFNVVDYTAGTKQVLLKSEGLEVGIDANGHAYATFIGKNGVIGTSTITETTIPTPSLTDPVSISVYRFYEDGTKFYGIDYFIESSEDFYEGNMVESETNIKSGKIIFGQNVKTTDARLLGTVSIPQHDTYTYNNGVWTKEPSYTRNFTVSGNASVNDTNKILTVNAGDDGKIYNYDQNRGVLNSYEIVIKSRLSAQISSVTDQEFQIAKFSTNTVMEPGDNIGTYFSNTAMIRASGGYSYFSVVTSTNTSGFDKNTNIVLTNSWTWTKIIKSGSTVTTYYSFNGSTWTQYMQDLNAGDCSVQFACVVLGLNDSTDIGVEFDLNECYVKDLSTNTVVWTPYIIS